MKKVITFSSDFGWRESYVAEMKGAFFSELSNLSGDIGAFTVIDASHDLPKFDIRAGARMVNSLLKTYPKGSIHIIVVDPGVGSERRALAVSSNEQWFIGPDNGIFTPLRNSTSKIVEIDSALRKKSISRVFDGRDLFAPAAARLALDMEVGAHANGLTLFEEKMPIYEKSKISGEIIFIDSFGNLKTNILFRKIPNGATVKLFGKNVDIKSCYNDSDIGTPVAIESSDNVLEIAVREGSAYEFFSAEPGAEVFVTW